MKKLIIILIVLLLGCNSFEPHVDKSQPQSCNDQVTFMKLIVKSNGMFSKEGTTAFLSLLTLTYADCKKDRVLFKNKKCFDQSIKIIYGDKPSDDKEKYAEFKNLLEKCKGIK